ncbi:undecaprenyl-diphosphate phosphatase [Phytomonospora endophytica]|uniref:Undecaprenyl-diphosphatase n=1 Tax=Phytomonospora endophytica TaxID=714109 RepID=A0A841FLE4_9ACTN|nr:undecaprenyl-diphosphate phosphatase [Phytomonospora endophytica]MBB6035743.1 undecaprenyl-diphosphatase [Phytomonospora endophytica]GIG69579.1 undecaprenyl-diphosphatase 1 [Phytomonospora endophytica]
MEISIWQAVILGILEGLTEFLPVSSTGHLTIAEGLMGIPIDDKGVTAYTAVVQMGAIAAVYVYFWKDLVRMVTAWFRGLFNPARRQDFDYRFTWYVIAGSIPIGIVGFFGEKIITGPFRSLWVVAFSLILWSGVMAFADHAATHQRKERDLTLKDTLWIGFAQCLALIPGISRSGATISVGLLRDLDRTTAANLSFYLSLPAVTAAGFYQLPEALDGGVGAAPIIIGLIVCFVVAYFAIKWLLAYIKKHSIMVFVWYRVGLGLLLITLLVTGVLQPT